MTVDSPVSLEVIARTTFDVGLSVQDDGEGVGGAGFSDACGSACLSDGEPGDVIVGRGCGDSLIGDRVKVVIGASVVYGDGDSR